MLLVPDEYLYPVALRQEWRGLLHQTSKIDCCDSGAGEKHDVPDPLGAQRSLTSVPRSYLGPLASPAFFVVTGSDWRFPVACPEAASRVLLIFEWLLLMAASALPSPFKSPVVIGACPVPAGSLVAVFLFSVIVGCADVSFLLSVIAGCAEDILFSRPLCIGATLPLALPEAGSRGAVTCVDVAFDALVLWSSVLFDCATATIAEHANATIRIFLLIS